MLPTLSGNIRKGVQKTLYNFTATIIKTLKRISIKPHE
jgi:hypothetical protein